MAECPRGIGLLAAVDESTSLKICRDTDFIIMRGVDIAHDGQSVRLFGEWRPDNAATLRSVLNLGINTPPEMILTVGWKKWGGRLADKLRGPFALVIADHKTGATYCARDAFGLAPFFYNITSRGLIASNRSRTVRMRRDIQPVRNEIMIADFLAGETIEKEQTYFEDINRLAPGCHMIITANSIDISRYWDPRKITMDEHPYRPEEQFRHLFDSSTAACHVAGQSGLLLSGGLDSSAIAGSLVANNLAGEGFPVFSLTYRDDLNWSDGKYLDTLSAAFGFDQYELASSAHNPLSGLKDHLRVLDGPYLSYGHSLSFRLQPLARQAGCNVVLCGHGGDEIVSYGFGRLNELARQGEWLALWREARGAAELHGKSRAASFKPYLRQLEWYRRLARRMARRRSASAHRHHDEGNLAKEILSDALANQIDPDRHRPKNPMTRRDHDDQMVQSWALDQPIQVKSLEVYAICSEADSVRTSMPFYSRDLAEFSLSLPSRYKLNHGVTRTILRSAMKGALPESVLNRNDKFNFANHFIAGMSRNQAKTLDLTDPAQAALADYVNPAQVHKLRNRLSQDGTGMNIMDAFALWRVAVLAMWLNDAD